MNNQKQTFPGFRSRWEPQVYVKTKCAQCNKSITVIKQRVDFSKSGKVFCGKTCNGKNLRKYHTAAEKREVVRKRSSYYYHRDDEARKRLIAQKRAWLERKKKEDPVWFEYYKGRMKVAVAKYQRKQKLLKTSSAH